MVKHQSKCLLEVTKSSSHNRSDRMIESSTNQTYHNQPPLYQKHMGTYCFNTHLDVFFLLTNAPLQFENRLLNTTMALSSKIKRATRMYILRRYHLPAVAMCAMKISISGRGFLHGDDPHREIQIELHIEFKSDEDAERCTNWRRFEVICCAIALHIRKKLKEQVLMGDQRFDLENRNST